MKKDGKRTLVIGVLMVMSFAVWTWLIQTVDVQPVGVNESKIGFAAFNCWFHELTEVHMGIYLLTDWMGLVPLLVCLLFGSVGFMQLIKRRSLQKVDFDIILLGIYYIIVVFGYFIFEMIPINYRPILIDGFMETSYPSSTTLLVLSVMPTLIFQVNRRIENLVLKLIIWILTNVFSVFMVLGRLISGVHWFTDIVGSVTLSTGLFCIYKAVVLLWENE